ncbi:glyoxalase/bleomycin resistance/extradiol dioxygenase family protein [Flavipsychrobacter stenotrophus]|uniref:Glyoxalase/bleomycin resistance/extradiol dioxygenase family protein n=1 Tax=Flavipsychrobacter stenotrophus TaxID=2077091 RepID=A0A2S7STW3_9BACT|nr:VOC family protein [Flavipsychrobacter stenotrophus]PQJ10067.1 glyoxalase/bleomycin resistance/extradiol dioxygenase family protein [Flavipsychrobacter stenotrophus]
MNLNQVTVPSVNIPAAIAFYQRLGLKLIVEALPHYARFECPDGTSTFSVHLTDRLPDGEGTYVYFECDDLDGTVASLIASGTLFEELPNDKSWLWREARLRDQDNNIIILYYAGDNRKNPPWRVN